MNLTSSTAAPHLPIRYKINYLKYKLESFFFLSDINFVLPFLVSCSDDKTLRVWQSYKPGNPEGSCKNFLVSIL